MGVGSGTFTRSFSSKSGWYIFRTDHLVSEASVEALVQIKQNVSHFFSSMAILEKCIKKTKRIQINYKYFTDASYSLDLNLIELDGKSLKSKNIF